MSAGKIILNFVTMSSIGFILFDTWRELRAINRYYRKTPNFSRNLNLSTILAKNCDENCSICQENYKYNEKLCVNSCGHEFHFNCLNKWIKYNLSCPLCRKEISTN